MKINRCSYICKITLFQPQPLTYIEPRYYMTSKILFPSKVSALSKLNRMLKGVSYHDSKLFIIVDENTYSHCLPSLIAHVPALEGAEFFEVPVGEEAKSIEIASQLWESLLQSGADRNSVIINLGGGCVCDLGGFVAAGFKRGIRYINIPTTLIAMADAAIGGKTAVNLDNVKNPVGFFWQPEAVCMNPFFLDSLPSDELANGFFEVLKTLYISDSRLLKGLLFDLKFKNGNLLDEAKELVVHCATFKSNVAEADPTEQSVRKILNFGHTFGHGIESFAIERGMSMSHGIAVGIGMLCELYLSVKKTGLDEGVLADYRDIVRNAVDLPCYSLADTESILKYMRNDKKNHDGLILCVLLQDYATPVIDVAISENEVRDALLKVSKL